MSRSLFALVALLLLGCSGMPEWSESSERIPVILDTDIGTDIDDAFALALILSSPELELRGVTTVSSDAYTRALIVCRFLQQVGRVDIPVAAGKPPLGKPMADGQYQYGLRPIWGRRPQKESAVDFLYNQLKDRPGELTLLGVGDLTNFGKLITQHPECKPWIKRIVIMGGAVRVKQDAKTSWEWNIRSDIKNARVVFTSGVPLVVAPLDATIVKLEEPLRKRIFAAGTPVTTQLRALYPLWNNRTPTLFDPVATTLCFTERFCRMEDLRLEIDDEGVTNEVKGPPNARVAMAIRKEEFLEWYTERVTRGAAPVAPAPPEGPANVSAPVERGPLPARVHVIEDYETDIEKRWWLAGNLETKNVPPDSVRACRGVLTNNFDHHAPPEMNTAVVFNPVPGPPMGKNTRLGFRYWLKGADRLRVQIYSLTRGYHRYLTLVGLPQESWQSATVDMTAARRPDGGGDALGEGERIDDIQFYVDPEAELLIDDIVLYDEALAGQTEPFPKRLLFTAGFDTGEKGSDWSGDFDIVPHERPMKGRYARSVTHPQLNVPWVRLYLRGERTLGAPARLRFRYRISGADSMSVRLLSPVSKSDLAVSLKSLPQVEWTSAVVDFDAGGKVNEIEFLLPRGAELQLDDVLLYEPGRTRSDR